MDRLRNPYRPGAGTAPPELIGRDEITESFEWALRRALAGMPGKSFMLVGLRGVGKTVLLNRFVEIAQDGSATAGFVEASDTGDFKTLLAISVRRILLELRNGRVHKAIARALGALKSFTIGLPDGSSMTVGVDALAGCADSGSLSEDLTDLLVAAGQAASACESGVLLAVDEAQYLGRDELAALIAAIHRTAQQNLPVVLACAGLPQLPGLAGEAQPYAERLFEVHNVDSLSGSEALDAVRVPARGKDVEFEDGALELIADFSSGYPYFLQEWGYHTWNAAPASPITADDVRSVRAGVLAALDRDFFRVRLDRLTPKERQYLAAMASLGPGPHRSGDIAAALGVKVQSVGPRRSALIAKGMVYSPAHGDTAFTVPLFDDFLRRVKP